MKKGFIILAVVVVILIFGWMSIYNTLATKDEKVDQNQSEIDNQLKRRAELIPNLISTVKGLTSQELTLVNAVTEARVKMSTGTTQEKLAASSALTTSINVLVENYPALKSDTAFVALMDELAGSQNRITTANKAYNDEVGSFNAMIKRFPSRLVASMSGFEKKTYLEITEADKALPEVDFNK